MTHSSPERPPSNTSSYRLGQDNIQVFGLDVHNPVFLISSISIVSFVILTLLFPDDTAKLFGDLRPWLTVNLDWFFMSLINALLGFCLYLALSKYGKIMPWHMAHRWHNCASVAQP